MIWNLIITFIHFTLIIVIFTIIILTFQPWLGLEYEYVQGNELF